VVRDAIRVTLQVAVSRVWSWDCWPCNASVVRGGWWTSRTESKYHPFHKAYCCC
jgi:hypothetical protein